MRIKRVVFLLLAAGGFWASADGQVLFQDNFDGSIDPAWNILHQDTSFYSNNPTELALRASHYDIDVGGNHTAVNLFTLPNPTSGDFSITLRLNSFVPVFANNAQLDLIALDDEDNLVRAIYGYINNQRSMQFGKEVGPSWLPQGLAAVDMGSGAYYLRLTKLGTNYYQLYSMDGTNYTVANGTISFGNGSPAYVGFCMGADPTEFSQAHIDSFTVEVAQPEVLSGVTIATAVQIAWPTETRKTYQLQSTVDLSAPNWTNYGGAIAGTGSQTNVFSVTAGDNAKYFRVLVSP